MPEPDERLIVRSAGLRDQVLDERERLRREEGLDLTISKTAARLIRLGLRAGPRVGVRDAGD